MKLSFGRCVLDITASELTVGGKPRHLTVKQFQLLDLLIEQRLRALSKAELHHHLWPGTFVSDSALSSLVAQLRQIIGDHARESGQFDSDDSRPRVCVQRAGFGRSRSVDERRARLSSPLGPPRVALGEGENILGRQREALVWIDDPRVSRQHAVIDVHGSEVTLVDQGSKNGTFVNGRRVEGQRVLQDGDTISVGDATFTFRVSVAEAPTVTATRRRR